tara:strand:+ start:438 stop:1169 length:732 start_codon:yes stop_codon:yes gene_type:complete
MIKHLILFFLLSINQTYGQELQNGLILPEKNEDEEICCIYSPKNGFTVYDQPNGEEIGRLIRNVDQNVNDQSFYQIYFVDLKTKKETKIGLEHFQEIAYEIWAITYSEKRNGFVKIRYSNQDLWLKQSEIESVGFALVEWQSFLTDNVDNLLGYYANDLGLNLREKPKTASRIIRTLKGDTNQISPTNEHNGLWTKVKVIISKEHPCGTDLTEEENIIEEVEGWIKIVDDNGLPNLWYYSRGC